MWERSCEARFEVSCCDGTLINSWTDPWIPDHPPRAPRSRHGVHMTGKVSELFRLDRKGWDEQKLNEAIVPEDVTKIIVIKISPFAWLDVLGVALHRGWAVYGQVWILACYSST